VFSCIDPFSPEDVHDSLINKVYVHVFLSLLYEFSFLDARNLHVKSCSIILWHVDLLPGSDFKISSHRTAISK
jgi:hypothetical protein